MTADPAALQREHERQQALLRALWQQALASDLQSWLRGAGTEPGLQAYRTNAVAGAQRALASDHPTVQALLGDDSFAALARACWQACPPVRGDFAAFSEALPGFIEQQGAPPALPYLTDIARLDLLVARAERAADVEQDSATLALLGTHDPAQLRFTLAPGLALLPSQHPVVTIWAAHHGATARSDAAFAAAREALHAQRAEVALVWRQGWKGRVEAVPDAATTRWFAALLEGRSIAEALQQAGDAFAFEPWLLQALQQGWALGAWAATEHAV